MVMSHEWAGGGRRARARAWARARARGGLSLTWRAAVCADRLRTGAARRATEVILENMIADWKQGENPGDKCVSGVSLGP